MSFRIAGAAAALLALTGPLAAQEGATEMPTAEEMAEVRDPTEVILARRILMTTANQNLDELLWMIEDPQANMNPDEAIEHAGTISTLLLALPHLFPPDTNVYSEELEAEEAGLVSLSLPAVWEDYGTFYAMAEDAADIAYGMARATTLEAFVTGTEDLQGACNACHDQFRRPAEPMMPIPAPEGAETEGAAMSGMDMEGDETDAN